MRQVPLSTLENKIVKPGFEKHLKPLVMYRGNLTLGQAHRMWNLVVSGMEHEATFSDLTQRLQLNPDFSQLCGPDKRKQALALTSFLSRVADKPAVMGEMSGLAEYMDWLQFRHFKLTPVSEISYRSRNMGAGGWRLLSKREIAVGNVKQKTAQIVYPFLIHDGGKPEHVLLRKVNAAVPKYLDPDMRADICQDLMVGILCGDFSEDDLRLPAKEMTKRVRKMFPDKYGHVSLDENIPGMDGVTRLERLTEEDSLWARI